VLLDGRSLPAYVRAYEAGGRVYAPVRPLVTQIADRLWFDGNVLVIERAGRSIRIPLQSRAPDALDSAYVAIAPVLRALGAAVTYQSQPRRLLVRSARTRPVATPAPFDPNAPAASARPVFTPEPVATPRPVWTGSPLPRRTPLPCCARKR
jgi:hypothetical protein